MNQLNLLDRIIESVARGTAVDSLLVNRIKWNNFCDLILRHEVAGIVYPFLLKKKSRPN